MTDTMLAALADGQKLGPFRAAARYDRGMDHLVYLTEDVSYVADRVDRFLTILWHPSENRLVGIKLKGFRYLFTTVRATWKHLTERHFSQVITLVEFAMAAGVGREVMRKAEAEAKAKAEELRKYELACEFVARKRPKIGPADLRAVRQAIAA